MSNNTPIVTIRVDPNLVARARVGLMLPANSSVSEVVRAALELAGGIPEPDGKMPRGWDAHKARKRKER